MGFVVSLFGTYFWSKVCLFCADEDTLKGRKPLSGCRLAFQFIARLHIRLGMLCLGYLWIRVKGKTSPRDKAPILVCNHMSMVLINLHFGFHLREGFCR